MDFAPSHFIAFKLGEIGPHKYPMQEEITYFLRASGYCHIGTAEVLVTVEFDFGLVEVDRDVFGVERPRLAGYYFRIKRPDGTVWIGRSATSVVAAMREIDGQLSQGGVRLLCAGLHKDFFETALSEGTGFGYIGGQDAPVHITDWALPCERQEQVSAPCEKEGEEEPKLTAEMFIQKIRRA